MIQFDYNYSGNYTFSCSAELLGSTIKLTIDFEDGSHDTYPGRKAYVTFKGSTGGTLHYEEVSGSAKPNISNNIATVYCTVPKTNNVTITVEGWRASSGSYKYFGTATSSPISVIVNSAPTPPSSITVPGGTLYSSTPVDISWSASTDPDGDSVSYELERQLDGSG